MTLCALSYHECLKYAWSLYERAECIGISFSPLYFEALLMECEQRGLFEHEIAFLRGLEGAAGGNYGADVSFGAAAKQVLWEPSLHFPVDEPEAHGSS